MVRFHVLLVKSINGHRAKHSMYKINLSCGAPCTALHTLLDKPNTYLNQLQHKSGRCSISKAILLDSAWLAFQPCYSISE